MREANRLYYPPRIGESRAKTFGCAIVWAAVFGLLCTLILALCGGGN